MAGFQKNKQMKNKQTLFFLLFLILQSCSNKEMLSKEDAERSLKVLNSDLINFGDKVSETPEVEVLKFLISNRNNPFPFYIGVKKKFRIKKGFNLATQGGVYNWDSSINGFKKTKNSPEVVIVLDANRFKNTTVYIKEYNRVKDGNEGQFTTTAVMLIKKADEVIWELHFKASVGKVLLKNIALSIKTKEYKIVGDLNRTVTGNTGKLFIDLSFVYKYKKIIDVKLRGDVVYSKLGYNFNRVTLNQTFFDHYIKGVFDYGKVNPMAADYVASFNKNANIELFESGKGKVGNLVLSTAKNNELLNYDIQFSDNSKAPLGQHIVLFEKLLNIKF